MNIININKAREIAKNFETNTGEAGVVANLIAKSIREVIITDDKIIVDLDCSDVKKVIVIELMTRRYKKVKTVEEALKIKKCPNVQYGERSSVNMSWQGKQKRIHFARLVGIIYDMCSENFEREGYIGCEVNHIKPVTVFYEDIRPENLEVVSKEDNGKQWRAFKKLVKMGVLPNGLSVKRDREIIDLLCENKPVPKELLDALPKIEWNPIAMLKAGVREEFIEKLFNV